jgi:hypothetical protein
MWRLLPRGDGKQFRQLKKRTLTNLYDERHAWLENAERAVGAAVTYNWPRELSDDEILERVFRLNQERAAFQQRGQQRLGSE